MYVLLKACFTLFHKSVCSTGWPVADFSLSGDTPILEAIPKKTWQFSCIYDWQVRIMLSCPRDPITLSDDDWGV